VNHRIETIQEKKLTGKRSVMSFSGDKTFELWRAFMPRRKEIADNTGTDLYSVQIYPEKFFQNFDPDAEFEKWAAMEVTGSGNIPEGMERLLMPGGLYAVFLYRGASNAAEPAFRYIFNSWLPDSDYLLDNRPHFEVLGEKYKNDDPDSEEELWIPVRPK
jgi:AraC family transcriptional regulator